MLGTVDFGEVKSEVPFTRLFIDQNLEQKIKGLKRHGEMVGLSQDEVDLDVKDDNLQFADNGQ